MQRRQLITAAGAGAGLALFPTIGWSQDVYPSHTVKLVVPFPPGGPTDTMGRAAANAMSAILGQPFVVENKAGAGGNIGTAAVAKANERKIKDGTAMDDDERRKLVSTSQSLTMSPESRIPSAIAGRETFSLSDAQDDKEEEVDADSLFNLPNDADDSEDDDS